MTYEELVERRRKILMSNLPSDKRREMLKDVEAKLEKKKPLDYALVEVSSTDDFED